MKTYLLLTLFWLSIVPVYALDITQPASVHITVQDSAGHPLRQVMAVIGVEGSGDIERDQIRLDAAGQGQYQTRAPQPASNIFWTEHLRVTLNGYLPFESDISFFPGARMDVPITLYLPRTTRLHLRGPSGEAVSGVSVQINYETPEAVYQLPVTGYTDARGDFVFTHPPLKSGFTLSVGSNSRNFRSRDYPDVPAVTATLSQAEMPPSYPPHPMQITLIAPDGTPASGWQVAPHVNFTGSSGFFSGVISLSMLTNYYAVSGLIRTDKNGLALIPQAEDHLVVISPQGIPFLYPLHPQTWPAGLHHITLRLPPLYRTQTGRLTYPDGKPAASFPIHVTSAHTGIEQWQVNSEEPIGAILTDADGRYTLPQYFGTRYEYASSQQPWAAYDLASEHAVLEPYPGMEPRLPSYYKQITLKFVNSQGKLLPETEVSGEEDYQGTVQTASNSGSGIKDIQGVHLFLPQAINRVVITTQAHDWNPLTKTLELPGTDDQEFTITMPQSLRLKPLQGVLVDPQGKPVPGVTMPLFGGNPYPNSPDKHSLQFSTTTDAHGAFSFADAPDSCEIDLYRFNAGEQADLPGWTDPPQVTPKTRKMVIRLKPFLTSTVCVLLPPSVAKEPKEIYLESAVKGAGQPDYLSPHFDPKAHTLVWNRIPPGRYKLVTEDPTILPVTARLDQAVTMTEGRETKIDLRGYAAAFPQPPTPVTVRINTVRGAIVTLWTDQQPYERHLPVDIADDDGSAWLPLGVGQTGVVVTYLPGRMIGYADLTVAGGGESISLGMQPVQALTVPMKPLPLVGGKPPDDSRTVSISPAQMKPDEAQAVFLVLGLLNANTGLLGDGPVPTALLPKDSDGNWVAYDLPPGKYQVQTGSDITLPDAGN